MIEVQLPSAPTNPSAPNGTCPLPFSSRIYNLAHLHVAPETKHRGFAFVTYSSTADAQDAIDNMDLNELNGRVLRVNLARPMKGPTQAAGNRASASSPSARVPPTIAHEFCPVFAVWESEDWLRQYAKPLAQSGGTGVFSYQLNRSSCRYFRCQLAWQERGLC